jgi:hypothetical protein
MLVANALCWFCRDAAHLFSQHEADDNESKAIIAPFEPIKICIEIK